MGEIEWGGSVVGSDLLRLEKGRFAGKEHSGKGGEKERPPVGQRPAPTPATGALHASAPPRPRSGGGVDPRGFRAITGRKLGAPVL